MDLDEEYEKLAGNTKKVIGCLKNKILFYALTFFCAYNFLFYLLGLKRRTVNPFIKETCTVIAVLAIFIGLIQLIRLVKNKILVCAGFFYLFAHYFIHLLHFNSLDLRPTGYFILNCMFYFIFAIAMLQIVICNKKIIPTIIALFGIVAASGFIFLNIFLIMLFFAFSPSHIVEVDGQKYYANEDGTQYREYKGFMIQSMDQTWLHASDLPKPIFDYPVIYY